MERDFDILEYPFKVRELSPPVLVRTKTGYEVKVSNLLDSKKIVATKSRRQQKYIHLEICGGKCRLVGYTENLYTFTTPADFYVPVSSESRSFYEDVYVRLVHGDMNQCLSIAERFNDTYRNSELPMYPVPLTSTVESFENYNLKDFRGGKDETGDTIHVSYWDDIPSSPTPEITSKLESLHGIEVMNLHNELFNRVFSMHPILRISNIIKMFNSDEKAADIGLSSWKIKKLLPLYGYFVTSGPWRGCWVRFGIDPKTSQDNFRYQIYDSRKSGKTFQIFEAEDVVREVERNIPWYLADKPNFKTGFHNKALLNLLKFRSEVDFNIEDESDLEFEVFD